MAVEGTSHNLTEPLFLWCPFNLQGHVT
uniref:Uncharacterized protein n=1 Tax=Arundo donax TaxID=35708 RepID=A0A0A9CD92_ARUDO